jgi:hypothetical protein
MERIASPMPDRRLPSAPSYLADCAGVRDLKFCGPGSLRVCSYRADNGFLDGYDFDDIDNLGFAERGVNMRRIARLKPIGSMELWR